MHSEIMNQDASQLRTWVCIVCGWVYDERTGSVEAGLAAGLRWEDVPDDWTCPDCGVPKRDFEMVPLQIERGLPPC